MTSYQFPFLLTFLPVLVCLLDSGTFIMFEQPCTFMLIGLLCLEALKPLSKERIITFALLISVQSFLYFGVFGLQLISMPCIIALGMFCRNLLYPKTWYPHLLLTIALLVHYLVIDLLILGLRSPLSYTLCTICANVILVSLISLISTE